MGSVSKSRVCYLRAATPSLDIPHYMQVVTPPSFFCILFDKSGVAGAILKTLSAIIILHHQYFLQNLQNTFILHT